MLHDLMRDTTSVLFSALAEGIPRPSLPRSSTSARFGGLEVNLWGCYKVRHERIRSCILLLG